MRYARIQDGVVAEIIVVSDDLSIIDVVHPSIAATCVAAPANIQPGQTYGSQGFGPVAPLPEGDDDASSSSTTFKADVIRRCTDDEADAFDAALAAASSKLRLLWNSITVIDHGAPEFGTLRGAIMDALMSPAIGLSNPDASARVDELLAPSE